ncbi:hypothetical protein EYF80_064936 [Liparis tanakae]|uniref:Uncharacterized protein n=1 Tax=Liparis tanakae TaxID=230148 RepID=A0A4Z2E810_9TELE|nr:hypothetical protein EYF80_064936 [Liparis tanakae]
MEDRPGRGFICNCRITLPECRGNPTGIMSDFRGEFYLNRPTDIQLNCLRNSPAAVWKNDRYDE